MVKNATGTKVNYFVNLSPYELFLTNGIKSHYSTTIFRT